MNPLKAMKAAMIEIDQLWPAYMKSARSDGEKKLIADTDSKLTQARRAALDMISLLEKGDLKVLETFTIREFTPRLIPARRKLARSLNSCWVLPSLNTINPPLQARRPSWF